MLKNPATTSSAATIITAAAADAYAATHAHSMRRSHMVEWVLVEAVKSPLFSRGEREGERERREREREERERERERGATYAHKTFSRQRADVGLTSHGGPKRYV